GFFPAEAPLYLMFVMLENPRAAYWGGMVAAPTFKRIAQRMLATASLKEQNNLSEKITELTMNTRTVIMPDVTARPAEIAIAILEYLGLKVIREGEGDFVVNQDPAPGVPVPPQANIKLNLLTMQKTTAPGVHRMPNLAGYSVREALQRLALFEIEPVVRGSGRVVRQFPAAGTPLSPGMHCEIECQTIIPATKTARLQ
ncbi:MAG: PASTA domain-containing protein, partial [candidate division KSB1 bacterium]|nr:PASTA domain-containing protein [candidate division KSB1 bacterium]